MYKQTGLRIEPLTRELCTQFARMPAHRGERPLSKRRVSLLDSKIANGQFHSPEWAVAYLNGKAYRVNGQHSSTALAEANGHFPNGLEVTIKEFTCESEDDLADLFMQFDNKSSSRSDIEALMVGAAMHPELEGISKTSLMHATNGIARAVTRFDSKVRIDDRRGLIPGNTDFIQWVRSYTGRNDLRRVGVIAAMYDTYRKDRQKCDEFWRLVSKESHADPNHPTRRLARLLKEVEYAKKSGRGGSRSAVGNETMYAKCVHAWNAFRRGRSTDMKVFSNAGLPTPI